MAIDPKKSKIDRRSFLGYGAAAGAGVMMSGIAPVRAAARRQSADLNVALIGAGAQGQVLLDSCVRIDGLRFRAVCDIWTEFNQQRAVRLLRRYGNEVTGYEDYREMIAAEQDLDAVIIATPDFWHAAQTIDCLNAGLHVYCEK